MKAKQIFGTAILLSLAFFILYVINFIVHPDYTKPNYEIFSEMFHSKAYESFSPNPNYPMGTTERRPPNGTIARNNMPYEYEATKEGAMRAHKELVNPLIPGPGDTTAEASFSDHLTAGEAAYNDFCVPCHGLGGAGDGPVVKHGFPPPPNLNLPNARNMKDGDIFHIITVGRGNMPPLDVQVRPEVRWETILYIRKLQESVVQDDSVSEKSDEIESNEVEIHE